MNLYYDATLLLRTIDPLNWTNFPLKSFFKDIFQFYSLLYRAFFKIFIKISGGEWCILVFINWFHICTDAGIIFSFSINGNAAESFQTILTRVLVFRVGGKLGAE